mmetsp:Transcript_21632/g.43389  ORF Transcript_21632/g.43389 Transcript_21632/m.43389 type:complete len:244 (+) Transcript_21632:1220-1951(+)
MLISTSSSFSGCRRCQMIFPTSHRTRRTCRASTQLSRDPRRYRSIADLAACRCFFVTGPPPPRWPRISSRADREASSSSSLSSSSAPAVAARSPSSDVGDGAPPSPSSPCPPCPSAPRSPRPGRGARGPARTGGGASRTFRTRSRVVRKELESRSKASSTTSRCTALTVGTDPSQSTMPPSVRTRRSRSSPVMSIGSVHVTNLLRTENFFQMHTKPLGTTKVVGERPSHRRLDPHGISTGDTM